MEMRSFFKYYLKWLLLLALLVLTIFLLDRNLRDANIFGVQVQQMHVKSEIRNIEIIPRSVANRLKVFIKCKNQQLRTERSMYGEYWLIKNLIVGNISRNIDCVEAVTYTTNGDYTFFENVETVAERWRSPISFAIYAPGYDFNATMDAIQYVRNCLPKSEFVRDFVTFHVYFPATHMPTYVPLSEPEALKWKYNCKNSPPYLNVNRNIMYKSVHNMTYPINVGRNIARKAVNTHFIFACDIELYPSLGFVRQFLEMVDRNHSVVAAQPKHVFPLPVFELQSNARLPNTKSELLAQLQNKTAQPFHARLCKNCHLVPQQDKWMNATDNGELTVFSVGLRQASFKYWEPFYISDNTEPYFDERVTWEGQHNKRIQGYAMCLLNYEYHVLHPAFLVHSPGIKLFDGKSPRLKYAMQMARLIKNKIEPEYRILYGENKLCTT